MIKKAISLLFLIATVLSLYNVYADNRDTVKLAENLACGASGCVRMLRAERTPIGQNFSFQTNVQPARTKAVSCQRAYLLLGGMSCVLAADQR
jgi:hypothetical protein